MIDVKAPMLYMALSYLTVLLYDLSTAKEHLIHNSCLFFVLSSGNSISRYRHKAYLATCTATRGSPHYPPSIHTKGFPHQALETPKRRNPTILTKKDRKRKRS
jgi:hypothetical protein